jgi:hypothetical protein
MLTLRRRLQLKGQKIKEGRKVVEWSDFEKGFDSLNQLSEKLKSVHLNVNSPNPAATL